MKIEFAVPFRRVRAPRTLLVEPIPEPESPPPRIARLLAAGRTKLDALVRTGASLLLPRNWLAWGHITAGHALTQIMLLLHLAPSIQEYLLFISPSGGRGLFTELGLRKIAREPHWGPPAQTLRAAFQEMTCF